MNKFSEFIKENPTYIDKKSSKNNEDINKLIDKYSTYSQEDLMREFLEETEKKKANGELGESELNKIQNILSPYLTQQQSEKLTQILDKVKQ